jgi:hypothetical protein
MDFDNSVSPPASPTTKQLRDKVEQEEPQETSSSTSVDEPIGNPPGPSTSEEASGSSASRLDILTRGFDEKSTDEDIEQLERLLMILQIGLEAAKERRRLSRSHSSSTD